MFYPCLRVEIQSLSVSVKLKNSKKQKNGINPYPYLWILFIFFFLFFFFYIRAAEMIFLWIRISQSDDPKGLFCPVVWFSIQTYWWNTSTDLKPLKIIFSLAVFLIGSNVCLMTRSAAIRHEPSNYFQIEEVMETNPVISS